MKKDVQQDRPGPIAPVPQVTNEETVAARYAELYEHAPVAYFTLLNSGEMTQANRAGAQLLNRCHTELRREYFQRYISNDSQLEFEAFLRQVFERQLKPSCEVTLELSGQISATVHIDATLSSDGRECWAVMTDITPRNIAELALAESGKRYKTLIDHAPFCVHEIDLEGRLESVNRAGLDILEATDETEVCGVVYLEKVSQQDRPRIERLLIAAIAGEASYFEFTSTVGPALCFKSCFIPIRDDAGKVIRILGISEDITERRRSEDAIRTSNQLLEASQSIGKLGGWELDLTTGHLFWTSETYRIHDTSPDQFDPNVDAAVSYYLPKSRVIITEALKAAKERGVDYDLELEMLTTTGRRIDVRTTCDVTMLDGSPSKLTGIFQDITEHKRTEVTLRENQAKLELAIQAAHIGPWNWDLITDEVYFSPEWKKQIGYEDHELANEFQIWVDHIHPNDRHRIMEAVQKFRDDPDTHSYSVEFRFRHKDGSYRWIHTRAILLFDSAGRAVRMFGAHLDFTDRKLTEDSLLRSQRLESLGTLAGGVAHDLNNALAPILMGTDLLRIDYPGASDTLDLFEASAKRAAEMVQQLLTFAKGTEGERVAVDVGHLINEIHSLMRGSFPKNIDLDIHVEPTLPAVLAEATQLHRIFLNLCINARDAMPNGGTLSISTETRDVDAKHAGRIHNAQPGTYVRVEVCDTGVGIPSDTLDRIFEPFFSTKEPQKGTGLGLSTAMGIVKSHGGFMEVSSQPGVTTKAAVYLPVTVEACELKTSYSPQNCFRGNGELILFVDDEVGLRKTASMTLKRLNFRPATAVDGADGLTKLRHHQGELSAVILDLHMPRMSGLEFARELREILPRIPVLVSSGRMDSEIVAEFRSMGVYDFLGKPFTLEQLAEAMETLLRRRENQQDTTH